MLALYHTDHLICDCTSAKTGFLFSVTLSVGMPQGSMPIAQEVRMVTLSGSTAQGPLQRDTSEELALSLPKGSLWAYCEQRVGEPSWATTHPQRRVSAA